MCVYIRKGVGLPLIGDRAKMLISLLVKKGEEDLDRDQCFTTSAKSFRKFEYKTIVVYFFFAIRKKVLKS